MPKQDVAKNNPKRFIFLSPPIETFRLAPEACLEAALQTNLGEAGASLPW
jgi:hypothetical protein